MNSPGIRLIRKSETFTFVNKQLQHCIDAYPSAIQISQPTLIVSYPDIWNRLFDIDYTSGRKVGRLKREVLNWLEETVGDYKILPDPDDPDTVYIVRPMLFFKNKDDLTLFCLTWI